MQAFLEVLRQGKSLYGVGTGCEEWVARRLPPEPASPDDQDVDDPGDESDEDVADEEAASLDAEQAQIAWPRTSSSTRLSLSTRTPHTTPVISARLEVDPGGAHLRQLRRGVAGQPAEDQVDLGPVRPFFSAFCTYSESTLANTRGLSSPSPRVWRAS